MIPALARQDPEPQPSHNPGVVQLSAAPDSNFFILARTSTAIPVALSDGLYVLENFGAFSVDVQREVVDMLIQYGTWLHLGHLDMTPTSSLPGLTQTLSKNGQESPLPLRGNEFVVTLKVGSDIRQAPTINRTEATGNI
jgi:hypothetical protein